MSYYRKCDLCEDITTCPFTSLTETLWYCDKCADNEYVNIGDYTIDRDALKVPSGTDCTCQKCTETSKDILIKCKIDELYDINRTVAFVFTAGKAEITLEDGRKLRIELIK
jgi:hypothetical protein